MSAAKLMFYGKTDVGRQRTNNEDALVAEQLDENTILAIAIDGVGGYEGGEVAAEMAQKEIPSYLKEFNRGERLELLKQAVVCANNAICDRRHLDKARPDMSCVLTAALIDKGRKVVDMVHVGDTRMYQFHNGELRKISHDHSMIGYREEIGDLTEEEAMHHPQRNMISRVVGSDHHEVGDSDFLEAGEFPLLPNSTFLLCSDGLTDLITSKQIVEVLEQTLSLEEKVQALIDAANEAGGKDNITVVLVEYQAEEEQQQDVPVAETTPQVGETQTPDNTLSDKSCKKDVILAVIAFLIVTLLLPCLTLWHHQKTRQVSAPNPDSENVTSIDTLWEDEMEVEEFTLMYDVDTDHPWSSYLSTDSNYVLRLEKLYEDSFCL